MLMSRLVKYTDLLSYNSNFLLLISKEQCTKCSDGSYELSLINVKKKPSADHQFKDGKWTVLI